MNQETQFKLQAYLDGELPVAERAQIETLLQQDAVAVALLAELRHTTGALTGYEAELKLPESREFYWSKIQREIQRQPAPVRVAEFSVSHWLRRMLVPAGALAAIAIAVMLSVPRRGGAGDYFSASGDAVAFTYQNYNTGTTLVWLDFSSENDFSDPSATDTLN
jgi:anti-sigma factor RsiW